MCFDQILVEIFARDSVLTSRNYNSQLAFNCTCINQKRGNEIDRQRNDIQSKLQSHCIVLKVLKCSTLTRCAVNISLSAFNETSRRCEIVKFSFHVSTFFSLHPKSCCFTFAIFLFVRYWRSFHSPLNRR